MTSNETYCNYQVLKYLNTLQRVLHAHRPKNSSTLLALCFNNAKVVPALPRQILSCASKTVISSQAGKLCRTSLRSLICPIPERRGPTQPPLRKQTSTLVELITSKSACTKIPPIAPRGPRRRSMLPPLFLTGSNICRFSSQGACLSHGWVELLHRRSHTPCKRSKSRVRSAGWFSSTSDTSLPIAGQSGAS